MSELEELRGGSFYIADTNGKIERHEIRLKEVVVLEINLADGVDVREIVQSRLASTSVKEAIVILKLRGVMSSGQLSHLNLAELEFAAKKMGLMSCCVTHRGSMHRTWKSVLSSKLNR